MHLKPRCPHHEKKKEKEVGRFIVVKTRDIM
jgi:hypothetical protein